MAGLPKISCFCSTYGRVRCLEEAIYSFLQQDYCGEKELVILNDREDQVLAFEHPEVTIINSPDRIEPLGKKFNRNIDFCDGDVLAVWENDDIALPHRLTFSVERMRNGVFHTNRMFYESTHQDIAPVFNYAHTNLMLTRELFDSIGGYAEIDLRSLDLDIFTRIEAEIGPFSQDIQPLESLMIYRWATVSSCHGSAQASDVSQAAKAIIDKQIAAGIEPTGVIELSPRWNYNYLDYIRAGDGKGDSRRPLTYS